MHNKSVFFWDELTNKVKVYLQCYLFYCYCYIANVNVYGFWVYGWENWAINTGDYLYIN